MFCSNCGAKISKDGQFCPKCGQSLEEEKVKSARFSGKKFLLVMVAAMISASAAVLATSSHDSQLQVPLIAISAIISGFLIIWIIIAVLKSLFKLSVSSFSMSKNLLQFFIRRPLIGTLIVLVLTMAIFAVNFYVSDYEYKQMQTALGIIQDSGVDAAVAKSNKNSYMAKQVSDRLSKLETASRLNDYKLAIKQWADTETGSVLGDPGPFVVNLTADQAQDTFKVALSQITQTKGFGDDAIKKGDRITMRYIAAKLLIQNHWLEGVATSEEPGFLSVKPSIVYALEQRAKRPVVTKQRNICLTANKRVCLNDVTKIIPGIYRSALGYGVGDKDAAREWHTNWTDAAAITEAAGQPQGGTGITQGDKDQPQNPPAVQAFLDECKSKGGYLGGGVKERLPTTEDGRTCRYQDGKCWDLLTYSGGRYKGGNSGCPEQGLVPKPPEKPAPKPQNKTQPQQNTQPQNQGGIPVQPPVNNNSWDGVYQVTSEGSCDSNAPISIGNISPFSSTFTVRGNQIINPQTGQGFPIGSQSQVNIPINVDAGVGVSISFNQTFVFSRASGEPTVSGTVSVQGHSSVENVTFNFNCHGTFSGRRVSS